MPTKWIWFLEIQMKLTVAASSSRGDVHGRFFLKVQDWSSAAACCEEEASRVQRGEEKIRWGLAPCGALR